MINNYYFYVNTNVNESVTSSRTGYLHMTLWKDPCCYSCIINHTFVKVVPKKICQNILWNSFQWFKRNILHLPIAMLLYTVFTRVKVNPPFCSPKISFPYFWVRILFYPRIFFQICYGYRKNLSPFFFISLFDPCLSRGRFFGPIFRL